MLQRAGLISITKADGPNDQPLVHIRIMDTVSATIAADTFIEMKDLALALTGNAKIPCKLLIDERVGLTQETKHETIVFSGDDPPSDEQIEEAVKQYEVDGWIGHREDTKNQHRWGVYDKDRVCTVLYERHVKQDEEKKDEQKNQSGD